MSLALAESALNDLVAECYADPLRFVRGAYPWGEPGPLEHETGPDVWQVEFLKNLGEQVKDRGFNGTEAALPIRNAVSSGHGIGKSALVAWLVDWIMSTRPNCRITVTANTNTQLDTKTWPSVAKWTGLCLTAHWFTLNSDVLYRNGHKKTWFCSRQTCDEKNSEAFAGQHEKQSTSAYLFDEASAIPDQIFEVAEGGLTDGEPMMFLFGNCTRSVGAFYRAVFGGERKRWVSTVVDSRTSRLVNQANIAEQIASYGEDSDWVRVRVRGIPPRASDVQFIDQQRVAEAQTREVVVLPDEPLLAGADLAWGGCFDDETEILTDSGWKLFSQLDGHEQVLTLHGHTSAWGPITAIHQYAHDGMLNLHEADSANFCITDNHNLLVRTHQKSDRYALRRFDALPKLFMMKASNTWSGISPEQVSFETIKPQPHGGYASYQHTFQHADWAEFLGWFVAEGNVYLSKPRKGKPNQGRVIELSQRHPHKRAMIEALLARMGITHSQWSAHGTTRFQHQGLGDWLIQECGQGASRKRVPRSIRNGSGASIRVFLDAFRLGDGNERRDGTGRCYHTSSRLLADDLQECMAKIGCAGKLSFKVAAGSVFHIDGRKVIRKHDMWTVYERAGISRKSALARDRFITKKNTKRVHYRGYVWCVSTPHRTIYVRRQGVPMWSGNSDDNVVRFRCGNDARSIPPIRVKGEFTRDPAILTTRLAEILSKDYHGKRVSMLFLDSAGIAGPIASRLRAMGHRNIMEVNFGSDSPDAQCRYMRDYIWQKGKEWLLTGAIDGPMTDSGKQLEADLTGPGIRNDNKQRVWLEDKKSMKARGLDSPDDADALFLTFAAPVAARKPELKPFHAVSVGGPGGWMAS